MSLDYREIMGLLEQEFFLAKIKSQVDHIEDPQQLRQIVLSLVNLLQYQKDTFLKMLGVESETNDDVVD